MHAWTRTFPPARAFHGIGLMAVLLAACSAGSPATTAITVTDSAGLAIVTNDLSRLLSTCAIGPEPTLRIGVAEGQPEYELHRVFGAATLSDGRIVLVNQGTQELRFYDSLGTFVGRAGRPGEGPGEFRDAFYLRILPGDTLFVGDYRPWQFLVFDGMGEWIRTVRPTPLYFNPPDVFTVLDDGRMIFGARATGTPGAPGFVLRHLTLALHGAEGGLTDTITTLPNGRWGTTQGSRLSVYPLFEPFARADARGDRLVVGHGSTPELQVHSVRDSIRLERIIRWTTPDRRVTASDVAAEHRRLTEGFGSDDPERRARFLDPLLTDERPVAEEFPAFSTVRLARDGGIWIREYPRPTESARQRWIALVPDGGFRCRVVLPDATELLEIGTDHLLMKEQDDDGVESVARYALQPPADR